MHLRHFTRSAVSICGSTILLSACGGSQTATTPAFAKPAGAARSQVARSWMDSSGSRGDLIYISSNDRASVYVYTYPRGRFVGTLTGFREPFGECTDAAGDVFITDTSNSTSTGTIYEYAHGGTTPIAVLSDPEAAHGCSVDPTTGNLAVSGGGVAIYQHASGSPTVYESSEFHFYYCGYDDQGNLYISGTNGQSTDAQLLRLARGSAEFEQISLNVKLHTADQWPSVQWHGRRLTVTSNPFRQPITVYRLRISGSTATVVGTTTLSTAKNDYHGQTWIQGSTIIGLGRWMRGFQDAFFWPFPKGGEPKRSIEKVGNIQQIVWGVTVSVAQSR